MEKSLQKSQIKSVKNNTMRIGIDLRWLQEALSAGDHRLGGIGYYSLNLVQNLLKVDPSNEYVFFLSQDFIVPQIIRDLIGNHDKLRLAKLPKLWRFTSRHSVNIALQILQERLMFVAELARYNLDIYHSIQQGEPPPYHMKNTASIVTVHDLTYFIYPELLAPGKLYRRLLFSRLRNASKAKTIIADSECTKKDILRFIKVSSAKVKVIYLGVGPAFRPLAKESYVRVLKSKFRLNEDYILHVGGLSPTKNVEELLKAYKRLLTNYRMDIKLVIAGRFLIGKHYNYYRELINKLDLSDKVIEVGDVTTEELVVLYNGACVFVYPSLYEGFGLPVAEAMACGTPVIASKTSSIPEVMGKVGILVDPCDISEIADAILKVLSFNSHERAETINKGLVQAKLFSWEKTAQATLEVYREAYKQLHL